MTLPQSTRTVLLVNNERLATLLAPYADRPSDAHYLAFLDCFNRGLFFEAHEVLEQVWLPERGRHRDLFYKGLIQLAGAFVHVQKGRAGPAMALLELAKANLARFAPEFQGLNVNWVLAEISAALQQLQGVQTDLSGLRAPELRLG